MKLLVLALMTCLISTPKAHVPDKPSECNVTQEQLDAISEASGTYEITPEEFCEI